MCWWWWWWWIRREKMWWWLYIVSLFTKSCWKKVESRIEVGSMWVDVGSRLNSIPLLDLLLFQLNLVKSPFKEGTHCCYCAHFLPILRQSRATRKKCATRAGLADRYCLLYKVWEVLVISYGKDASFFNRWKIISIYLVSSLKTEEVCACCYFYVWSIWPNILKSNKSQF